MEDHSRKEKNTKLKSIPRVTLNKVNKMKQFMLQLEAHGL